MPVPAPMMQVQLNRVAFLDFESSGLGEDSYPISAGIAFVDSTRPDFHLIRPQPSWTYWDHDAERRFHNISRSYLLKAGQPASEAAREMYLAMSGYELFSDNAYHEKFWCEKLFATARLQAPVIHDSKQLFISLAEQRGKDLEETSRAALSGSPHTHRADEDAMSLREVFLALVS